MPEHIRLDPTGTHAGWTFSFDGKAPEGSLSTRNVVSWAVRVADRQKIRLATGNDLNKLPGHVRFFVGDATPEGMTPQHDAVGPCWGRFRWYEELETRYEPHFPENYEVDMYVSQRLFERLESLVAANQIPKVTLSVGSKTDGASIKVGWEPDGSGLEWDNVKRPQLEVVWCDFDVDAGLPVSEDDDQLPDQRLAPPTKADLAESVTKAIQKIGQVGASLLIPLWLIALLLAWLVLRR
jgi:hypothetical protein